MVSATLADVTEDSGFARLVSLACHDLRTPLATVNGFARTLTRFEQLEDPMPRYLQMMATAADQMGALLDDLGLVARIESGRWEAAWREADTFELARGAAARVEIAPVEVTGTGTGTSVEPDAAERALAALARCAVRHGGLERLDVGVDGAEIRMTPVNDASAGVLVGEDLRDFGAAVAGRVVSALGGSVAVEGEALVVRLRVARS
jgi:signal transduction histidine kinase